MSQAQSRSVTHATTKLSTNASMRSHWAGVFEIEKRGK